ncbi:MAG: tetratricopeptide repeat protein [Rhodanobacteraceae bacterium]|nr:tetratricopeptide repeat protein [Rhodanobacteraceae bacterium]
MADDIIDAHEQSERARQWLQKNGSSIVIGILLGLAVLLGWQRWQQSGVNHRAEALVKFDDLQAAVDKDDKELASKLVEDLRKNYADTTHAALGALELAEMQLKGGQVPEAESSLRFVVDNAQTDSLRAIASLRLARVLLARGEAQSALDALKPIAVEHYVAERNEVRGDALLALGKNNDALKAYNDALAAMDVAAQARRTLEAKRDDLAAGGAPATAAAPAAAVAPAAPAAIEPAAAPAAAAEAPEQG